MTQQNVSGSAILRFEASCCMEKRPGFYCCGIANPDGLPNCPKCGAAAGVFSRYEAEQVAVMEPWFAKILFRAANWLIKVSERIERMGR